MWEEEGLTCRSLRHGGDVLCMQESPEYSDQSAFAQLTRWQSRTLLVVGLMASTMRGPMVMLGTNLEDAWLKEIKL